MFNLPKLDSEPVSVTTLYPDPEYQRSYNEVKYEKQKIVEEKLDRHIDIIGITHTDADGYGCEVMLRKAFPNKNIAVFEASNTGPNSVKEVGKHIKNITTDFSPEIYIMDHSPNENNVEDFIKPFENFNTVFIVDHHEWPTEAFDIISNCAEIIHDKDSCATKLVHDTFISNPTKEITELAEIIEDHDLWLKNEREKSDAISDFAQTVEKEHFVYYCVNEGINVLENNNVKEFINEFRDTKQEKIDLGIKRTEKYNIEGYTVSMTYGSYPTSDLGEELYTNHNVDLACMIYPNGIVSFRSHDNFPFCKDIASKLGGGGHNCAAGAKPDFVGEDVKNAEHVVTHGLALKSYLRMVVKDYIKNNC